MPGIIKWDDSNYDPNSYEEQTIYGEVNRAEFEKYYIVPEGADLRGVIKVTLQADPAETEITQPPVFRWRNGDFAQPDNTMFVDRSFQMGATGGETADLVDGMAKVKERIPSSPARSPSRRVRPDGLTSWARTL